MENTEDKKIAGTTSSGTSWLVIEIASTQLVFVALLIFMRFFLFPRGPLPAIVLTAVLYVALRLTRHNTESPIPGIATLWSIFRTGMLLLWSLLSMIGLFTIVFVAVNLLAYFLTHWNARMRSNEVAAVTALKGYAASQVTFSYYVGNKPEIAGRNTTAVGKYVHVDNFRNLYYGIPKSGERFHYIGKAMADAFIVDNILSGTQTLDESAPQTAVPHTGYFFQEDASGLLPAEKYNTGFALMAFPERLGETGRYVFWIGSEGIVYSQQPKVEKGTTAAQLLELYRDKIDSTPLSGNIAGWDSL